MKIRILAKLIDLFLFDFLFVNWNMHSGKFQANVISANSFKFITSKFQEPFFLDHFVGLSWSICRLLRSATANYHSWCQNTWIQSCIRLDSINAQLPIECAFQYFDLCFSLHVQNRLIEHPIAFGEWDYIRIHRTRLIRSNRLSACRVQFIAHDHSISNHSSNVEFGWPSPFTVDFIFLSKGVSGAVDILKTCRRSNLRSNKRDLLLQMQTTTCISATWLKHWSQPFEIWIERVELE